MAAAERGDDGREAEANLPQAAIAIIEICDSIDGMASITIRQLEASTKTRLRMRAASHGRSMEQEAREILKVVLTTEKTGPSNLADSIRRRFQALGGVELPDLPRELMRQAIRFSK